MDLFLAADRRPRSRVTKRWQYQDGLDVQGMRTAAKEAEQTEGEEETDRMEMATE